MLDFQHLATQRNCDLQAFFGQSGSFERSWAKPRGCSMIFMLLGGAGGGGGGGMTGLTATVRGGGGGGSAGLISRLLIPAFFVPDTFMIRLGKGGPGGAATIAGSQGGQTRIYPPGPGTTNMMQAGPGGGASPGTTSLGSGGTTTSLDVATPFSALGLFICTVNDLGGDGTTTGTPFEPTMTSLVGPGGGGAGVNAGNASQIGGPYGVPTMYKQMGYVAQGGFSAAAGDQGWQTWASGLFGGSFGYAPMFFIGGAGGGSSGAGTGGKGGDGAPGSGGGGGGGGITGGAGGKGGDGFAIIVSF